MTPSWVNPRRSYRCRACVLDATTALNCFSVSVLAEDLLAGHERPGAECFSVQFRAVQVDSGDLMIVIGRVIVDPAGRVAAGGIDRVFICAGLDLAAAALLLYRAEDVEKLADVLRLRVPADGVQLRIGHAHEAGHGRQIAGRPSAPMPRL